MHRFRFKLQFNSKSPNRKCRKSLTVTTNFTAADINGHWWNEDCAAAKKLHRMQRKYSVRASDSAVSLLNIIRRAADKTYHDVIKERQNLSRAGSTSEILTRNSTSASAPNTNPLTPPDAQLLQSSTSPNANAPAFVPAHLRFV